jgi:hypothetical protein
MKAKPAYYNVQVTDDGIIVFAFPVGSRERVVEIKPKSTKMAFVTPPWMTRTRWRQDTPTGARGHG